MRPALLLSALTLFVACDTGDDVCTPAEPDPGQLTVCLTGDLAASATLQATLLLSFGEGVDVRVVEGQGRTDDGEPLGFRLFVAADEIEPGTYGVAVRSALIDGGGAVEVILPDSFEDVRDYRGVAGEVVVEAVASDDALTGRFDVELEDREGRRVDAVGRFRTEP